MTLRGTALREEPITARENDAGIDGYQRLWIAPDGGGRFPFVVYCLQLPEAFPRGDGLHEPVVVTGLFFKNWSYAYDGGMGLAPVGACTHGRLDPRPGEDGKTAKRPGRLARRSSGDRRSGRGARAGRLPLAAHPAHPQTVSKVAAQLGGRRGPTGRCCPTTRGPCRGRQEGGATVRRCLLLIVCVAGWHWLLASQWNPGTRVALADEQPVPPDDGFAELLGLSGISQEQLREAAAGQGGECGSGIARSRIVQAARFQGRRTLTLAG